MSRNLPLEAEPFANNLCSLLKHLGEVTAAFALDQDGGANNLDVLNRHSRDEIVESGFQFKTVVHFVKGEPELAAYWIGALARHQSHCGVETVPNAESA